MQNQISPPILCFGASDPTGAVGIQADIASFAAMGCHGVSVITSILIGDTTHIEDIQAIDADWVADQARTVLEDMPIAAFKVATVGSTENAAVIAEIMADYPDIPLILDPFISGMPDSNPESYEILCAMRDLLIPQSTLLFLSAHELNRLAETWREPSSDDMLDVDVKHILGLGCEYVFVTNTKSTGADITNTLYGIDGVIRSDVIKRVPGAFAGAGSTLSATITSLLITGLDISESCLEAQEFTTLCLTHAQRLGMGRLIPNRYFWAKDPDEDTVDDKADVL